MRVHNLVKDLVVQKVEELLGQQEGAETSHLAGDEGAKMDVVCYVLNRTPAHYVVSGRGMAHNENLEYQKKFQQLADITRLVKEGMLSVSRNRRERTGGSFEDRGDGPFYNFPSIIGRMFNGMNFEPIQGVSVSLLQKGELVKVIDPNWQNPYELVKNTVGTYLFWPHPAPAKSHEAEKTFEFELVVEDQAFEPLHFFFEVDAHKEDEFIDFVNTTASLRLKDLYLFPRE